MRILHVNTNYINNPLHQNMIDALNDIGTYNSVLVPTCDSDKATITPKEYVSIMQCFNKYDRINYYGKQKKILHAVENAVDVTSFDCVHAYTVFTDGGVAYNLNKKYGIPYVVAVRNTDINTFFKYMPHLRKKGIEILKNAKAIFFLSSSYRKRLFDKYIPQPYVKEFLSKTHIIPNGIDSFWLDNIYHEKQKSKKQIRVLCAGSIDENKNMLSVAKAIDKINGNVHEITFNIAGKVKSKKIFDELMKYDFVNYCGMLSKEQLREFYREGDIFALVSHKETFGMVYLEAMSQGLPVIYTIDEGFYGQFPEGQVGYGVKCDDMASIGDAIITLYSKHEEFVPRCLLGVKNYCWNEIVEKYRTIYRSII